MDILGREKLRAYLREMKEIVTKDPEFTQTKLAAEATKDCNFNPPITAQDISKYWREVNGPWPHRVGIGVSIRRTRGKRPGLRTALIRLLGEHPELANDSNTSLIAELRKGYSLAVDLPRLKKALYDIRAGRILAPANVVALIKSRPKSGRRSLREDSTKGYPSSNGSPVLLPLPDRQREEIPEEVKKLIVKYGTERMQGFLDWAGIYLLNT